MAGSAKADWRRELRAWLRVGALTSGFTIGVGVGGCWYPLTQLAPLAIGAAEDVGSGTVYAAAKIGESVSGGHKESPDEQNEAADFQSSTGSCTMLLSAHPGVIQLRKGGSGDPEYRDLHLSKSSTGEARWTPLVEKDTAADGWRPAINFLRMDFSPPLANQLKDEGNDYLVYAPAESQSPDEQSQLEALASLTNADGTFDWKGRVYRYGLTPTLPCVPPS